VRFSVIAVVCVCGGYYSSTTALISMGKKAYIDIVPHGLLVVRIS